jgi:hypothetical protein
MGFNMYLNGIARYYGDDKLFGEGDGFAIRDITVELGYWQKHPNLHGFIVKEFAGGVDNCNKIDLTLDNIRKIAQAIMKKASEGKLSEEEKTRDLTILGKAIEWLSTEDEKSQAYRGVYYQAS